MKQFLLAGIAVVAAIGLNSFTVKTHTHPTLTKNFIYLDYPNDANALIPSHYALTGSGGTDDLDCPGGEHVCGVIAVDNGSGHPDFTQEYTERTKD